MAFLCLCFPENCLSLYGFEDTKREILSRVDIVELVSEHVRLKRSGQRWVGLCPFHPEKTPSFTIRPEHGSFKCFGCGKGGDVFTFVQLRENLPFMEAMRLLADRAGVSMERSTGEKRTGVDRTEIAKVNAWALKFFRSRLCDESIGRSAREYVVSRGFSDETAESFGLGLATGDALRQAASKAGIGVELLVATDLLRESDHGGTYETFRDRLMFPIKDSTSRVVGFGGRTLVDDRAKYLNTRQTALFDKGRCLYAIDKARHAATKSGRAILVEGYTDCIAAHQAGFGETVATLGTALTEMQVDMLRRYCDEIVLLFDSDDAGAAAAERAIRVALPRCVRVRLARIPEGKDPGEFLQKSGAGPFSDVLSRAVDALEFKWIETRNRFQADQSDAKRREAVRDFLSLVAEVVQTQAVDTIQRGLLVNQVAHLLRMDRSDVDRLLRGFGSRRTKGDSERHQETHATREVPRDAEQASWMNLLEVLLNQPGLLSAELEFPDWKRIEDERCRRIMEFVVSLAGEGKGFGLSDVLARLGDPEDVAMAVESARRGAERGNFENTFSLALERIRRAVRVEEVDQKRRRVLTASQVETDGQRDDLAVLTEEVREHRSFAPRRLIRQASDPST